MKIGICHKLWDVLIDRPRRRIDLQILWPALVEQADCLEKARAAFYYHIKRDSAWTNHFDDRDLIFIVDGLYPQPPYSAMEI